MNYEATYNKESLRYKALGIFYNQVTKHGTLEIFRPKVFLISTEVKVSSQEDNTFEKICCFLVET
jgi:hypothetical protein